MSANSKRILLITVFSIAMGFMEAAIVIYLRELYYPAGFNFPLISMSNKIFIIELLREAATIIMLLAIGVIAGKGFTKQFAYFIYSFAIWDIFYYVFLKVMINWPDSFFTWDILFLIPVPWIGPVIAPIILSITMVLLASEILMLNKDEDQVKLDRIDSILLITGSLVIIVSFTIDYLKIVTDTPYNLSVNIINSLRNFVPTTYNWLLFLVGELIILSDLFLIYIKKYKSKVY